VIRTGSLPDLSERDLAPGPIERASTIPAVWCVDPRFDALDREAVVAPSWQPVGSAEALRVAGALVSSVAGRPVIVARSPDGSLSAFHNVCRHRGGPLAPKAGATGVLQCRYHGWTYRTDGALLGAPHFTDRESLEPAQMCLPPVAVESWEGQVFVRVAPPAGAPDPAPLATRLGGLAARLGRPALGELRFARRVEYDVRCNWKVYVDNYLEGYHVPHVHPELMQLYDFRRYRTELFADWSLQVGPLSDDPNLYTPGGGEALYAFLFPNVMLNVLPGRLQTNLVVPVAADRCRVLFEYYYDDVASDAARARLAADLELSDLVQRQDGEICERVQEGLASGSYSQGRYCAATEAGVHHFQELLKVAYRRWLSR
jgi:choline monooxygenase